MLVVLSILAYGIRACLAARACDGPMDEALAAAAAS
jgi:hypothetical protein